jgi:OOP family OmpA-OmpF porin
VGHTDDQGTYDHNMDLSRRRAEAVAAAPVDDYGIPESGLLAAGVGYLSPVASNDTAPGCGMNRRVELVKR